MRIFVDEKWFYVDTVADKIKCLPNSQPKPGSIKSTAKNNTANRSAGTKYQVSINVDSD